MSNSEGLREYFKSVAHIPLLTKHGEIDLFRQLGSGDESVRVKIAEANQRLVIKIAKAYSGHGLPFSDLISEGNVGLMRAIQKFDLARKCRFATYAIHWIRQAISRAIQEKAHMVRPPVDLTGQLPQYRRVVSQLNDKLGRRPGLKEVARAMRVSAGRASRLDKAERAIYGVKALPEFESIDTVLVVQTGNEPWVSAEREAEARDMVDVLMQAVSTRERKILSLRYGLDGRQPMTLQEVGERLKVTRARVGQIQNRAMAKMVAKLEDSGSPAYAN